MYSIWFSTTNGVLQRCIINCCSMPPSGRFFLRLIKILQKRSGRSGVRHAAAVCTVRTIPGSPVVLVIFLTQYRYRLSFCCARDGCRKRVTPPSVRFLGRKVYLGAVVILVSAMRQGPTPRRVRELTELFGASRRTIYRWRDFWNEHFPKTKILEIGTRSSGSCFRNRGVSAVSAGGVRRQPAMTAMAGGNCFAFSRRSRPQRAWKSRFPKIAINPQKMRRRRS